MKKQELWKNIAIANLTYCRLKADLAAVEMEIAGNQPIANEAEGNFFLATLKRLGIGLKNELRKTALDDLEKDKALAHAELTRFEEEHAKKELLPIFSRLLGKLTFSSSLRFLKALSSINLVSSEKAMLLTS